MSFILQNSILLPLLLLASVPLLLHLFARAKPPLYRFSSNEFLRKVLKFTNRMRKPQDILLLIIRTIVFLLIVAIFLQPLFFSNSRLAALGQRKNIVIIVDSSASMGYVEGGQTRFAAACAEASELLSTLKPSDRANIIFIKSQPEALFPELGSNMHYLKNSLRQAKVSNEPGNVRASINKAITLLGKQDAGIKELAIISDFQTSQWQDATYSIPDNIVVTRLKTGKQQAANIALSKLFTQPLLPLKGESIEFNAEITNFSAEARKTTIYFSAGELHENRTLSIPPWGSATATFKKTFTAPGEHSYKFSVNNDRFPDDNTRWGVVKVAENLKIAIITYQPEPGTMWQRALQVLPWSNVQLISPQDLASAEHYDFLMLSGWNGTGIENIRQRMKHGTVVICAPAAGIETNLLGRLTGASPTAKGSLLLLDKAMNKKAFTMKIAKPDAKLFKLFSSGEFGDPVGGIFAERLKIATALLPPAATTLITYQDGIPALMRWANGEFYLWNIPLGDKQSNFARRVQFVPFMAEFMLNCRSEKIAVEHLTPYYPGSSLVKVMDFVGTATAITLQNSKGMKYPLQKKTTLNGNAKKGNSEIVFSLISPAIAQPGIYTWLLNNETIGSNSVNFAASESDLRTIALATLKLNGISASAGQGAISNIHEGINLWPYLLLSAIMLALLEGVVMLKAEVRS
jgi:von Willebrand factor type A domain/Aerotolerance regulator N-terminal